MKDKSQLLKEAEKISATLKDCGYKMVYVSEKTGLTSNTISLFMQGNTLAITEKNVAKLNGFIAKYVVIPK